MINKHTIQLSSREQRRLQDIIKKGQHKSRTISKVRILLKSNEGLADAEIVAHVGVSRRTVQRTRSRFQRGGIDHALYDAPRSGRPPTLTDEAEAFLVATACSAPPRGSEHWTLELLREKLLNAKKVAHISTVAIWHHLTERGIKPWREKNVVRADTYA